VFVGLVIGEKIEALAKSLFSFSLSALHLLGTLRAAPANMLWFPDLLVRPLRRGLPPLIRVANLAEFIQSDLEARREFWARIREPRSLGRTLRSADASGQSREDPPDAHNAWRGLLGSGV
jgi:hypothetical protein